MPRRYFEWFRQYHLTERPATTGFLGHDRWYAVLAVVKFAYKVMMYIRCIPYCSQRDERSIPGSRSGNEWYQVTFETVVSSTSGCIKSQWRGKQPSSTRALSSSSRSLCCFNHHCAFARIPTIAQHEVDHSVGQPCGICGRGGHPAATASRFRNRLRPDQKVC